MKRSLALLALAACALAASMGTGRDASALVHPMSVDDAVIAGDSLPRTLAEFGFFQDDGARIPDPRLVPYELNTALYSDGADKLRYLYVPAHKQVTADGDGVLQFPVGTAIIKTFAFGEGSGQRFIETRVLVHRADGWTALPYRWNAEQTEARLALAGGRLPITRADGKTFSYRIPNKNQCKTCHSVDDAVVPIGPAVRNLSPELLAELADRQILAAQPVSSDPMPRWGDETAGVAGRARAYLDVNCAHCHRPGGSASNSGLDLSWEQRDAFAIGVNKPPVAAGRGAGGLLVSIAPGEPDKSILVHRMQSTETGVAMPELGRASVDDEALAVIRAWIEEMGE
ncbi:SO2930 family diheme c-type cytochrome [Qipengyuania nanhaisediminis]|uniref:SO2930 family diheme c-type cytochrome n=1 Tax=Qipengyuania nanhaisediminis TaxID=604088 RepID=UPI0038B38CCE